VRAKVGVPELPSPAQLSGDLSWVIVGITAHDTDSAEDLLDGRMATGLYQSSYPSDDPDRVRSGFVNVNFTNFSLP